MFGQTLADVGRERAQFLSQTGEQILGVTIGFDASLQRITGNERFGLSVEQVLVFADCDRQAVQLCPLLAIVRDLCFVFLVGFGFFAELDDLVVDAVEALFKAGQ